MNTETKPKKTLQHELIEKFNWFFFGGLLICGLIDSLEVYTRITIILTSVLGIAVTLLYNRFLDTGPYDEKILLPLKLWPVTIMLALVVGLSGGISSGYIIVLFYPIIDASFTLPLKKSLQLTAATYLLAVLLSLFDPNAVSSLWTTWTLGLIQLACLLFVSYWINILADLVQKEQAEKNKILNLDREKSEFIGLASHHLRTPLTALKGYIDFFLRGRGGVDLPSDQAQIIERMDTSAKQLETLVENLLMAATMEQGKIKLNKKIGQLDKTIQAVVSQYDSAASDKNIKLVCEYPQDEINIREVVFDQNRIRKVLMNLLSNAIKFTEDGFVKVVLEFTNNQAHVKIIDTGIGISKRNMSLLFQKFSRVSSVRDAFNESGAGLGLYISRLIIEAHAGKIWVESAPGKGSVFHFTLPIQS